MFKLITKGKNWKAVSSALLPLAEEATMKIDESGIECYAMDPSHTEAIGFVFPKESFTEFHTEFGESGKIFVNIPITAMASICKRFSNEDEVTLISTNTATVLFTNGKKNFDCRLIVLPENEIRKPNIPYDSDFKLEISKLEDMMDDCKVFGIDNLYFETKGNDLIYSGRDDSGNVNGLMIENHPKECDMIGFNFTFMEPVLKSVKAFIESEVKMEMYSERVAPIRLTFNVDNSITIQYWLAPLTDPK